MDDPSRIRKDPDTGLYVNIPARIREIFRRNRFFRFMDIRLDDVSCGHCRIHMDTVHDRHANHRNVVHGGVITAVSNAVLALTAVTVGLRARTLSSNVVFIRNIDFDSTIYAEGFVENIGTKTVTVSAHVSDPAGRLVATVEATLEILGAFEGIPEMWTTPEFNGSL